MDATHLSPESMKPNDPGCKMKLIMKFTDLFWRYGAQALVYPSLIAKTHPHHFDGALWKAPHQHARIIANIQHIVKPTPHRDSVMSL